VIRVAKTTCFVTG